MDITNNENSAVLIAVITAAIISAEENSNNKIIIKRIKRNQSGMNLWSDASRPREQDKGLRKDKTKNEGL